MPILTFFIGRAYEQAVTANDTVVLYPIQHLNISGSSPTPRPSVSDSKLDSGIEGKVTIGPTCPVQQYPSRNECNDKPFAAPLRAVKDGVVKARFQAKKDGTFIVGILPGIYIIQFDSPAMLPRLAPVAVSVKKHAYTQVDLTFDSGIR